MWNKIATLCLLMTSLLLPVTVLHAEPPKSTTDAANARADIAKTLGFVPEFFTAFADAALPGAWEEMKGLQLNPATALSGKTKELIGLAVAAQVPCQYCISAHTEFAKLNGADTQELAEAVAVGGLQRHWSAYFYGAQNDPARFKSEVAKIVSNVKAAQSKPAKTTPQVVITDAASARKDIESTLGFVPEFLRKLPDAALPGAWRELKQQKLGDTRISAKDKALIALAVASQVPSEACVMAETEFAKLFGASEREIGEAIGMAAITRNMSTLLNGLQVDARKFDADIDRLVAGVKAAQKKASKTVAVKSTH